MISADKEEAEIRVVSFYLIEDVVYVGLIEIGKKRVKSNKKSKIYWEEDVKKIL